MSETQTPYLEALIARPADPAAAAVVVQRKIAELTKRLDAANRRGDRWRDHCAGLIVGVRRATQEANDLLALNRTVTADRDEGLALNNRLNSRVLALTGANKTLLHLLADSQTKADQRGQLNRALAADLEQCERENDNLRTLSLLDADAAVSRLTEIAALTNANTILSQ